MSNTGSLVHKGPVKRGSIKEIKRIKARPLLLEGQERKSYEIKLRRLEKNKIGAAIYPC